jgi:hypothetical protein
MTNMPTLKLTIDQWKRIRADLHTAHPKSVFMLKTKMQAVLGFTVREHNEWVESNAVDPTPDWLDTGQEGWYKGKHHEHSIRLDFYNERKYTMFLLKYSEYLNG